MIKYLWLLFYKIIATILPKIVIFNIFEKNNFIIICPHLNLSICFTLRKILNGIKIGLNLI